jgi:non-ribosomal peptide synthetase component F
MTWTAPSEESELALYLQSEEWGRRLAGLCMDRSLDMVVCLLGVMQAGGAYVPLDFEFPDERIAYMVQDSGAAIILTQGSLQERLRALIPAGTKLVALDEQWPEIHERAQGASLRSRVRPNHLAYVMYTSGSTGRPKGVMVEHRQIVAYVTAIQKKLRFEEGARRSRWSRRSPRIWAIRCCSRRWWAGHAARIDREAMTDAEAYGRIAARTASTA